MLNDKGSINSDASGNGAATSRIDESDFFSRFNLMDPGICKPEERKILAEFLNPTNKQWCKPNRVKIYHETHRRYMDRKVIIIRTRAADKKGKPYAGQEATAVGILSPTTAGQSTRSYYRGGAGHPTHSNSYQSKVVTSKEIVLRLRIRLENGSTLVLSTEQVRLIVP